mmetsp:Transcript_96021/g.213787  ORF Transcript_96021/g.213787 Transcript_96021/m.213787 type:complete len:165 (-) Transcript_96021:58-552(-)
MTRAAAAAAPPLSTPCRRRPAAALLAKLAVVSLALPEASALKEYDICRGPSESRINCCRTGENGCCVLQNGGWPEMLCFDEEQLLATVTPMAGVGGDYTASMFEDALNSRWSSGNGDAAIVVKRLAAAPGTPGISMTPVPALPTLPPLPTPPTLSPLPTLPILQ